MFNIKCWYSPGEDGIKKTGIKFYIRCSDRAKETMIDVDILDTTYQYIITTCVLNTMLHHVVMLWIIEKINNYNMIWTYIIQNG